ncbi:ankyrin [Trichoderma citrinoviride]|uniref:Ankyrin n=1 Tax=Trichoderma citrinoviride TaxID=58853 RepID=A0A2T4B156_9HYPO|nr:ankyrin [Trichoderma citrinoviride]PTB62951.1 ankyrin [Trichoderma citrinoviride]
MAFADFPELPAPQADLVNYIAQNPAKPMVEIMEPYRRYEAHLRSVFAQDRENPILKDPYLNVVPLFTDATKSITTRARDLASESEEEKSKYIMVLPDDKRRPHGSPATVANLAEFQKNFGIFSESSLAELDWNNVVAAGSSVVNTLLPVPNEFKANKRKLREYYHEKFCPASDVDLFLYGLTHDEAIEKIKQIEQSIRDSILSEVTVVRTKYAITIASQYPVRHVQVVLRVYKSVSEILTGFDIDAAGAAYDGKQVYVAPRTLGSIITQINHIDLSRRSPSYENRLSKYSHRNFEVYWPELDRSRVDPTIFERSFQRTLGLARLLVLERLPTTHARDAYLNKRRQERGRPAVQRNHFSLRGNLKSYHEDEVADWLSEEDVSNYHTFTVPYGEKFNAKRIEKLCYTRDLLLNAEWNQPKEREVYLHRHPAFFGRVEDVIEDCCGSCPKPVTPEEIEVAEKEAEIYISGKVTFLIDDPGRQQIGSFNPLTEQDWTDMAYVGNTARLFQSIVDDDVDDVLNWLSQEGADPNQRDYTGRAPLHLAAMVSSPGVVRCLVDHGARLTARLADGRTALHLAAARGHAEIIKILMDKSDENEEAEEDRKDRRRKAARAQGSDNNEDTEKSPEGAEDAEDSDIEIVDNAETETDAVSIVTGSFVKVEKGKENTGTEEPTLDEPEEGPDFYQINVLAWDVPCSPLHLAITGGHEEAVKTLCDYGADSILPVKFLNVPQYSNQAAAILTLTLALSLPTEKAKSMALLLLQLGATCSQADSDGCTAFHRYVEKGSVDMVGTLIESDPRGTQAAINHLFFGGHTWNPDVVLPLQTALDRGDPILVLKLLNAGASTEIDFDAWLKSAKVTPTQANHLANPDMTKQRYRQSVEQPLITAIRSGDVESVIHLLEHGANPNALTRETENAMLNESQRNYTIGVTALDMVQRLIKKLREYDGEKPRTMYTKPEKLPDFEPYLKDLEPGTYQHCVASYRIKEARERYQRDSDNYEKELRKVTNPKGVVEKANAIKEKIEELVKLEGILVAKGGLIFTELHPDIKMTGRTNDYYNSYMPHYHYNKDEPKILFHGDEFMTEARREGYLRLMEAAWTGDVETIKSLTLRAWGPNNEQPPCKMAIYDNSQNSPFSVAFLRGHHNAAKAILEIIRAQWSAPEKEKVRYKMQSRDDGDESEDNDDDGDESESDNELRIVSEAIDKAFTIDDVGQISMQVKSHVRPMDVITGIAHRVIMKDDAPPELGGIASLLRQAIEAEDTTSLKMLLGLMKEYEGLELTGDEEDTSKRFNMDSSDFLFAVQSGNTEALSLLIKRTGAGIPLDHLVKKSGAELKQKPRYYQGLTVYGKKRKDWATAGRNMVVRTTGVQTPPLLHAALGGRLEAVEFFLGDKPHRLYAEFAKSKTALEDPRLKHLIQSPIGFDRVISKWLGADNDFVLHTAILASPSENSVKLVEYLIESYPDSIERKTSDGDTPLMLACRLGYVQFAKMLIDANANQCTRNHQGENILHAAVAGNPMARSLRRLLDILDPSLRNHLFTERKSLQANGLTPLHAWISQVSGVSQHDNSAYYGRRTRRWRHHHHPAPVPYTRTVNIVDMLKLMLEYSKGEELDMLNGAGDTCLHTAVMQKMVAIVKVLVDFKPQLLHRENAVGRTPAEVAQDNVTADQFAQQNKVHSPRVDKLDAWPTKAVTDFVTCSTVKGLSREQLHEKVVELGLSGEYKRRQVAAIIGAVGLAQSKESLTPVTCNKVIWDLCKTAMDKNPGKRRLVSLNEANDVAKRLGEKHAASRYFSVQGRAEDDDEEEGDEAEGDEKDNTRDFAANQLATKLGHAWSINSYVAEQYGIEKCDACGSYHDGMCNLNFP